MAASFVDLRIGPLRLGLPLHEVQRVFRAAAVTPVTGARGCLLGLLDLQGHPTPVYDARRLLGLEPQPLRASDRFVLTGGGGAAAIFVADDVAGVVECDDLAQPPSFGTRVSGVRGVAATPDGMLVVQDLKRFMYLERALLLATDA